MDTETAQKLTSAIRYAVKLDKNGREPDLPLTEEEEANESRKNFYRLRHMYHNGMARRLQQALEEIAGSGCRRSDELCECGGHVKLIVTKNGSDLSPPLCPKIISIRRWRLDIFLGIDPDLYLFSKLLREAATNDKMR